MQAYRFGELRHHARTHQRRRQRPQELLVLSADHNIVPVGFIHLERTGRLLQQFN